MSTVQYPDKRPAKAARNGLWKLVALTAVPLAALALTMTSEPPSASATNLERMDEPPRMAPATGLSGKIAYCTFCHGPSGRGYYGFYTMPRLAGQSPDYIVRQLEAFVAGKRDKSLAVRLASVHNVSPSERAAIAQHFAGLQTSSASDGPLGDVATGRKIFNEGMPEANVPACLACHGPEAKGGGSIPRLASQLPAYTQNQLSNWTKARGEEANSSDETAVMSPIASNMTRALIDAVSAYLNTLR